MHFARAESLNLLWAIPLLGIFLFWSFRRRRKRLECFVSASLAPQLAREYSRAKSIFRALLLIGFFFFAILALARPQWGSRLETVKRRGVDIIAALDTSYSMNTEDVVPSRLLKAKSEIRTLIEKLRGDRFGLVCFAGAALAECPLTLDYGAASLFLDTVNSEIIPEPGTSIASALRTATSGFLAKERKYKVLVLFTDGEDLAGQVDRAVEEAKEAGVIVYTVGIGSPEGKPIPVLDSKGTIIEYRKAPNGDVVVSRLDEASLARIALLTGGRYFRASTSGSEIEDLYKDISGLEKKDLESKIFQNFEDRFQYPLIIAVLLLMIYLAMSEKRKERENWMKRWKSSSLRSRTGIAAAVLLSLYALPGAFASTPASKNKEGNKLFQQKKYADAEKAYVDAQVDAPGKPELLYNLGNALIKQKSYDKAVQALRQAAGKADKGLQQNSWYNLGNALFEMGNTGDAIQAYIQSLRMNPADKDAKRNLELALRKQEEQQKQSGSNQNPNRQQQNPNPSQDQQKKEQTGQNQDQKQQGDSQPNQDKAANPKSTQAERDDRNFSKERALQILDAIQSQEMTEQKKELERRFSRKSGGKDW